MDDSNLTPIGSKAGSMDLERESLQPSPFHFDDTRSNTNNRFSLKKSSSEVSGFSASVSTLFSNNKSFLNDMSALKGLDKEKADQYLRNKYGPEAQQRHEVERASRNLKTIEGAEILCVDCDEYISLEEVDDHSKVCFKALGKDKRESGKLTGEEKYEQADEKTKLNMKNEKLRKITEMLRKKIGKMHLEDPVNAEPIFNYCTMLIRCTDQIIVRNSVEEITELVRNIKDVNIFNKRLYEQHNKYSKMVLNLSLRIKQIGKQKISLIDPDLTWEQAKEMTRLSATMMLNSQGNQSLMLQPIKMGKKTGADVAIDSAFNMGASSDFFQDAAYKKPGDQNMSLSSNARAIGHKQQASGEFNSSMRVQQLNTSSNLRLVSPLNTHALNSSTLNQTLSLAESSGKNFSKIPRSPIVQRMVGMERSDSCSKNAEAMENSQTSHNLSASSIKRYKIKNPGQNLILNKKDLKTQGLRINQNMSNKVNPIVGESKLNTTSSNSILNESDVSGIFKEMAAPMGLNINAGIGKMKGKENLR